MNKIIVSMIGDNCSDTLEISLLSIRDIAKAIIFIWGMEDPKVPEILKEFGEKYNIKIMCIANKWDNEDRTMNGKARNIYLKELQKYFYGEWCLVLDPDEVLDNPYSLSKFIEENKDKQRFLASPRMRHFIWNIKREDAVSEIHHVPNRLFKIDYRMFYPEVEHPVLSIYTQNYELKNEDKITIWHFGNARNMFDIRKKYIGNMKKSNMHSSEFLINWYVSHLLGLYPTKEVDYFDYPDIIRKYFFLDQTGITDQKYFKNRTDMELKHPFLVMDIINYFKPSSVLDIGCGAGQITFLLNRAGVDCLGIDKSNFIINFNKQRYNIDKFKTGDITDIKEEKRDLVICFDILEHLDYNQLDQTLDNIKPLGEWFLFSIPFLNNICLEMDKTHLIKESRDWWIDKLKDHGFIIKDLPNLFDYKFRDQLVIAR